MYQHSTSTIKIEKVLKNWYENVVPTINTGY